MGTDWHEGYEMVPRFDLPPLGDMYTDGAGDWYWDRHHQHPVNWDELERAGYVRRIRTEKEYL